MDEIEMDPLEQMIQEAEQRLCLYTEYMKEKRKELKTAIRERAQWEQYCNHLREAYAARSECRKRLREEDDDDGGPTQVHKPALTIMSAYNLNQ